MTIDRWQNLEVFEKQNLTVDGLWLRVVNLLPRNRVIKIVATGEWPELKVGAGPCGPEGHLDFTLGSDELIAPESPPGALVAKIGGSTAGKKDGTIVVVGTFCVFGALEKAAPLFVAVNGAWTRGKISFTSLKIEVATTEP